MISALNLTGIAETDLPGLALLGVLGFILGFAINKGSICTVLATADLVSMKRPARSIALLEAALWAGLVYAVLESSPHMSAGWLSLAYIVPGTVLFALGSYLNGACVFGSVGHFGNGHIEFALVFIGIFIVSFIEPFTHVLPDHPAISLPPPDTTWPFLVLLSLFIGARFVLARRGKSNFGRLTLTMVVVGVAFTLLATFTPEFSITVSIMMAVSVPVAGAVTLVGLFLGSVMSGHIGKPHGFKIKWPAWQGVSRRFSGGLLMGMGAALMSGGNDTLLLVGLPGAAWQAFFSYALLVLLLAALIAVLGTKHAP